MSEAGEQVKALRMNEPRATRAALEFTFKLWLQKFAPAHFQRAAFGQYPAEYDESAKKDREKYLDTNKWRIERGLRSSQIRPGRESGVLENAFLHGSYTFGAAARKLSVRWPGLPRYVTAKNRYSGFVLAHALLAVNAAEYEQLQQMFERALQRYLDEQFARTPSRGRAVI